MWNVVNHRSNEFMLGCSVPTKEEAEEWAAQYNTKYQLHEPGFKGFEAVNVDFKYSSWFPNELKS